MNREEFLNNLDLYGADLSRWPAAMQSAARKIAQEDAVAGRQLANMLHVETMLRAAPSVTPDAAFLGRLLSVPARHPRTFLPSLEDVRNYFAGWMRWAASGALAASLLFGIAIGNANIMMPDDMSSADPLIITENWSVL